MSDRDRLQALSAALASRGVVDIKLTLSPEAAGTPFETVAGDVADFLEAYMRGEARPIEFIDAELPYGPEEFDLKNLARAEFENALNFGITYDNFERLALHVAKVVNAGHVKQRQALVPLLERVVKATVAPSAPAVTPEVIKALLHARRHGQQPCDNPADGAALERAGNELLGSVNAAWRSLGLKPSVSEHDALALVAGASSEAATKT